MWTNASPAPDRGQNERTAAEYRHAYRCHYLRRIGRDATLKTEAEERSGILGKDFEIREPLITM